MTRVLLWMLLGWVVWRLFRNMTIVTTTKKQQPPPPRHHAKQNGTFSNIEDAEFEDVTPKQQDKQ